MNIQFKSVKLKVISILIDRNKTKRQLIIYYRDSTELSVSIVGSLLFQEYEETCLFTKHESLQGDSPRVCTNILKCSLHSLVTKGIRLVGFATRAMVCESPTHYLILNSLLFVKNVKIGRMISVSYMYGINVHCF